MLRTKKSEGYVNPTLCQKLHSHSCYICIICIIYSPFSWRFGDIITENWKLLTSQDLLFLKLAQHLLGPKMSCLLLSTWPSNPHFAAGLT